MSILYVATDLGHPVQPAKTMMKRETETIILKPAKTKMKRETVTMTLQPAKTKMKRETETMTLQPSHYCHNFVTFGEFGKTRPDTRRSSRGRLGRSSNTKTARNSTKFVTDVPTYRPTQQGVESRARD